MATTTKQTTAELPTMADLAKKLVAIQSKLKAPKSQYNSFGKYKYRSCEGILEALKPLLAEQGCYITIEDSPIMVGDWHYIQAQASLSDGYNTIIAMAYARESETKSGMDSSQITGTASSYARKYALNGLFAIDDTKDADTMDNRPKVEAAPTESNPAEAKELAKVKAQLKKANTAEEIKGVLNLYLYSELKERVKELCKARGKELKLY